MYFRLWNPIVVFYFALFFSCCINPQAVLGDFLNVVYQGTGSGRLDGEEFGTSDFVITATADLSDIESFGIGFSVDHMSASISIDGVGTVDFISDTRTFVNNGAMIAGFSRGSINGSDLYSGFQDAQLSTWDLMTSIGPLGGAATLLQWGNSAVETSGGVLFFDNGGSGQGIFSAVVVPEPATGLVFGLFSIAGFLRRSR